MGAPATGRAGTPPHPSPIGERYLPPTGEIDKPRLALRGPGSLS